MVVLSDQLLRELESRLVGVGVRVDEALQPGLDDREIQALAGAAGIELPPEAVTWWRWRNGETRGPNGLPSYVLGGFLSPLPLDQAIADRSMRMRMAAQLQDDFKLPAEQLWSAKWLPILGGLSDTRACDLSADTPTSSLHWIATHDMRPNEYWVVRAPSLGTMVAHWIDAIDRGYWHFDSTTGAWLRNEKTIPDSLVTTGLV